MKTNSRRARRRTSAGYTAVEVLMSLAVLSVGVIGIIATEKVTLSANQHSKNLAVATHIAQSWIGMLNAEATLWNAQALNSTRQPWLRQGFDNTGWFRPAEVADLGFGPAFDALGNATSEENASYCVDLRVAQLNPSTTGGGMVRAEVRVMWLRDQPIVADGDPALSSACSISTVEATAADATRLVQFVFMSTAVRQVGG
jgi:Tfp pilus assembly protein PilV